MQSTFDFGATGDLAEVRDRLRRFFGPLEPPPQRTPMGQLVKSLISNRTYDQVSLGAYERLSQTYDDWSAMTAAPVADLEAQIAEVQFADRKAAHLRETLRIVGRERPDFDLAFLGPWPASEVFAWLERLPGVGRKVAASVLNFSTLRRPALVIDTHLKRILDRVGLVGRGADAVSTYDTSMNAAEGWSAAELTDLHVWMKRLGQTLCRPATPRCEDCPLRGSCRQQPG